MSFYYKFTLDYFTANETNFELVGASCNEVDIIDIENTNDRLLNTTFVATDLSINVKWKN